MQSAEKSLQRLEQELRRVASLPGIAGGAPMSAEFLLSRIVDVVAGWSPAAGVSDHGALTGNADDDHTQYIKEKASGGLAAELPEHTHAEATEGGILPAGVVGFEHISTITLTDDATADFVLQNSVYKSYLFVMENVVPATDDQVLYIRTDSDGSASFDAGASDYGWVSQNMTLGVRGDVVDEADSEIEIRPGVGSDTNESLSGEIWLFGPAATAYTRFTFSFGYAVADAGLASTVGTGVRLSAADVDAVQFLFSSGNLESGVIHMYGLKGD